MALVLADSRRIPLRDGFVQTVVTSPPYFGLRDYGVSGQIGLEPTPDDYVAQLVAVFREVWRVLKDDGTLWLNLGDSYSGSANATRKCHGMPNARDRNLPTKIGKPKDLLGIPWRVAFALQAEGWYLRSDIIWCLSGGARVYARTQKGDMPMAVKDLVRLDPSTVKLWNGEKWTQALGWSRSPDPRGQSLEIELASGERIGCTAGHVWPTQRGNVRAAELVVGDVVATTRLPEPDAPASPGGLTGVDDDVAWLCGLYLAEGSMSGDTVQMAGHVNQTEERLKRLERVARWFHGTARAHISENSASINLNGPVIQSVIRAYIHGDSAKNKGIKVRAWQRGNTFLRALLQGYLDGDGHYDTQNDRWRLGFTRNDRLAGDLRTLAARLNLPIRLSACTVDGFGRKWPAYRGDIRLSRSEHHNARQDGEIVAIYASRAREFWDIGVQDEPHLFALASGVLTHNSKPNPMPESVTDRPTNAHEYLFLLAKNERYFYDAEAIRETAVMGEDLGLLRGRRDVGKADGVAWHAPSIAKRQAEGIDSRTAGDGFRNKRSVWTIPTKPYSGAHFATMPEKLVEPCILAGSKVGDYVLDPFVGSGTVGAVSERLGRKWIGLDLNPKYHELAERRTRQRGLVYA